MSEHFTAEVESYSIYRYARAQGESAAIYVDLRDVAEGDPQQLRIVFYPAGVRLPPNEYSKDERVGVAHECIDAYPSYVDLLRHEKSCRVTFGLEVDPPYFVVFSSGRAAG